MERLDLLAERLAEHLDRADTSADGCVSPERLQEFLSGTLGAEGRAAVEVHLDSCLVCLGGLVALRDCLHGLATPGEASPRLRGRLVELTRQNRPGSERSALQLLLRPLTIRMPVGWAVAMVAAGVLASWLVTPMLERATLPPGPDLPATSPRPMTPLSQPTAKGVSGTVTGVVVHVRNATHNGVEAHILTVRDAAGVQYSIFLWGPLAVRAGDSVQVEGVFQEMRGAAGSVTYKGVATAVRPAQPR